MEEDRYDGVGEAAFSPDSKHLIRVLAKDIPVNLPDE